MPARLVALLAAVAVCPLARAAEPLAVVPPQVELTGLQDSRLLLVQSTTAAGPRLRRLLGAALGQHPPQRQPGRLRGGRLRLPRLDEGDDRPQPAVRPVRPRHRRRRRRVAGCPGDQLVLADARRPAAPAGERHGPGVPRPAPAVRQMPPPLRALEPGRLLRAGGLLHPARPQELRRTATVLRRPHPHHRRAPPAHREHLNRAGSLQRGLEDLVWALLNTREFLFNH